jgi:hypothetical protein
MDEIFAKFNKLSLAEKEALNARLLEEMEARDKARREKKTTIRHETVLILIRSALKVQQSADTIGRPVPEDLAETTASAILALFERELGSGSQGRG